MPKPVVIIPESVQTLALFWNPSAVVHDPDPDEVHRDNSPWYVVLPALGVTVRAVDPNGEPIVGYWSGKDAIQYALGLWNMLVADPKLLAQARDQVEMPDSVQVGHKVMQRIISVPKPQ